MWLKPRKIKDDSCIRNYKAYVFYLPFISPLSPFIFPLPSPISPLSMIYILTFSLYFAVLLVLSRITGRHADNDTFYMANRRSPWYVVAFGMIGASISGVTFVSVPGMVMRTDMTYMQTCIGFIFGYIAVAFILVPVYYKMNLTTIYTYLQHRLGNRSYKTGAGFFVLSGITGAAVRFYVACMLLHRFVLADTGMPFAATVCIMVACIWAYTRRGGVRTLVWTDTLQTLCMLAAVVLIIVKVAEAMDMTLTEAVATVASDAHSRIFVFDDWVSTQNFFKQFISGIFIVIVMTGLDQNMMQKNLTCKTLREAQKDLCFGGMAFVPVNLLFLSLGILLLHLAAHTGTAIQSAGDELLPAFAATGTLGTAVQVLFTLGVVAASFSSADSALTALTTSCCVDIMGRQHDERLRHRVHLALAAAFIVFIMTFRAVNSTSVIDAVYILCSYTYGPLLGLFAFGLLTHRNVTDRLVPYIATASPVISFVIDTMTSHLTGYKFGYELLLLNGMITFAGLWMSGKYVLWVTHHKT